MRNKWWQACKELLGRPGRNILIAICIFVLTLFCGIATFLDSAIESFYKSFADMAGCCVLVELDDFSTLDDWKDILEYADNNKNIVGYNNAFTSDIICEAVDFENVPYTEKQSDFEENKIYVSGNINTSYNEYFSSGIFKISKGKYPMSGDKGAMISDKAWTPSSGTPPRRTPCSPLKITCQLAVMYLYSMKIIQSVLR